MPFGYNLQASFITGYGGVVAPPFERAYLGGENDLRGFDIRTVSPIAYLPSAQTVALRNPDGTFVPANPRFPVQVTNTGTCVSNCWNIPVPYNQLVTPGGDLSMHGNFEYRITIAGPVAIAPFVDMGTDPILRTSQLQINPVQYETLHQHSVRLSDPRPPDFLCVFRRPHHHRHPAISQPGSWHQLGCAYVHRARIADHASGRQCALPHLLCLQRPAPR